MATYVDELLIWSHARGRYKLGACHLCADTVAELHAFAKSCGFLRSWYHSGTRMPHYDLTAETRAKAVQAGAQEVTGRDLVRMHRARRLST